MMWQGQKLMSDTLVGCAVSYLSLIGCAVKLRKVSLGEQWKLFQVLLLGKESRVGMSVENIWVLNINIWGTKYPGLRRD